jgi:uncharacterized protein YbaP (TraB family)
MNSLMRFLQISLLALLALLALLVSCAHAQEKRNTLPVLTTAFESVWLWRIDTPSRQIYIAGENHDHLLSSNELISHRLAYSAYELSDRVLLESVSMKRLTDNQLKNRLTPQTWEELATLVRNSIASKKSLMKNSTADQTSIPVENIVEFVNRQSDRVLADFLPSLLLPTSADRDQLKLEKGFLKEITLKTHNENSKKVGFLEGQNAGDTAWLKSCGQPSDTELLVREILNATGHNSQNFIRTHKEFLTEYRSAKGTTESISKLIKSIPLWETLNKCTVLPRNFEWITKIKQELLLSNSKQPLMIVVGIGHVIGDTGLLSLLCKEGYCQPKRILQIN